ncbi:MAG: ABC transporter ATP-binding protein [Clostridia bacterium]
MMCEDLLRVKDLHIAYKTDLETVQAVNGISFSLKKGEAIGLVGETGAGKTTTALSIMRLLPPRTGRIGGGEIEFEGVNLLNVSDANMRKTYRGEKIGMIFQDPMTALNPVIRVGNQIAEAINFHNEENLSKKQVQRRVDSMLELVGIPAFRKDDYPHEFSGGMKQRVVIAIALACEPDLLIADEPTTALDVTIQAQVLAMIDELRKKLGMSMILITHDLGIVARICDKVAVMYAGELVEQGSLQDVFTGEKHHPYTKGLFGSIPNLQVETPRLKTIDGLMPDPTNLPQGCKFSPRCKNCMEICKAHGPAEYADGEHRIACHLYAPHEA